MSSPWHTAPRNAFGALLADPETLTRDERLAELRRVAGRLAADPDRGVRWLAAGLLAWTTRGVRLDEALGLLRPRGSRRSVTGLARQAARDEALLRLAAAVGCDRRALRVLRGAEPCPDAHRPLLAAARAAGVPTGANSVMRARHRFASKR